MFSQAVKKVKKSRLSQFQGQSLFFLNNVENSTEKEASISHYQANTMWVKAFKNFSI